MDDPVTEAVLSWQRGTKPLEEVRNLILQEAFVHLTRMNRKGEDDVSEFLLTFHGRIERLLVRFRDRGMPFRHYLLRTLRWQWNSFRADQSRRHRQHLLTQDACGEPEGLPLGEGELMAEGEGPVVDCHRQRLVLLALKASPWLDCTYLERVCEQTGTDLAWMLACQHRLNEGMAHRLRRLQHLHQRRVEAFRRRLMAEDDARREPDPDRRCLCEQRAALYRNRLAKIQREQQCMNTSPSHKDLSELLSIPKGSVDSSLYHLKRDLASVYSGGHADPPLGHQQRPQKA